jgi:tetratricopeptide (TPR) repeat protein/transcriptional regulator with XRE-family HTH domain
MDGEPGFGDLLQESRLAAGLTQEELADRSGLSVRAIGDLERGRSRHPHRKSVELLVSALGLAPDRGARLHRASRPAIRFDEPVPASDISTVTIRTPAQLPADLPDFTGRAEVVGGLCELLTPQGTGSNRSVAVVTIAGAGGAGKTALAVHIGHRLRAEFPDGQLYLTLHGVDQRPMNTETALGRLLRGLGVADAAVPTGQEERAALYRTLLADRRVLVLLDNAHDAAQVRPLLPGGSGCRVLVTSRSPLPDLVGARLVRLDLLDQADSRTLFTRILGGGRAEAQPQQTTDVLRMCAGLPLAIRIAASRLAARPAWSVGMLADRLADQRGRLDELTVGDLGVRASFTVSYANLATGSGEPGREAARAFRMLGLAEGPNLTLSAAAALLGRSIGQVERQLETLLDAHLLESDAPGRYRAHDLLRLYAAELVAIEDPQAQRQIAVDRLLTWYLHTAAAAAAVLNPNRSHPSLPPLPAGHPALRFTSYDDALGWLDAEHTNLVAAVDQAADSGRWEIAWKLPIELWDLFSLRGLWSDCIATYRTGIAAADKLGDPGAEAWLLNNLSGAYHHDGQPNAALDCLLRALEVNRLRGDRKVEGTNLYNLAVAYFDLNRFAEARDAMHQAQRIHHEIGYRYGESMALRSLGEFDLELADEEAGIGYLLQALAMHREIGDDFIVGVALVSLCECYLGLGQPDQAELYAREAVAVDERIGHRLGQAEALMCLGTSLHDAGKFGAAAENWSAAADIFEQLGDGTAALVRARLAELDLT